MPRKKKNAQSPARVPGLSNDDTPSSSQSTRGLRGYENAMASNLSMMSRSQKEEIVKNMKEMFSHLDPEIIYIVLSECGFKVDNAMDSLLELSVAAEVVAPYPGPASGFELTAAALLSPRRSDQSPDLDLPNQSKSLSSPFPASFLTEEAEGNLLSSQFFSAASAPLSSFPPPPIPQRALPELLQSSLEPGTTSTGTSGSPSLNNKLSFWERKDVKKEESLLNYSHLISPPESAAAKAKPNASLDLVASGRPSAFQVYKKSDAASESSQSMPYGGVGGGVRSKVLPQTWQPTHWNPELPSFCPRVHGNQGPTFITPVASASPWDSRLRPASHWSNQWTSPLGSPKPLDAIPKSRAPPPAPRGAGAHSRLHIEGRVLVLLRGAPGSGKSTLARDMLDQNPGGVVLSTDDYFSRHGDYRFDPSALGEAHEWNHKRSQEAFSRGASPIIIDNTNMQGWEMRPYVAQALRHNFKVLFREPDTWWKYKPRELARCNKHNVPVEKIRRILDGYERFVSIQSIMGSQFPHQSPDTLCPDLVGEPGFAQGTEQSNPYIFSALPDVSSIGPTGDTFMAAHGSQQSAQKTDADVDDMDLLDMELDAHLQRSLDQGVPDCIVESVVNEDQPDDELPMAFSESIGQSVRNVQGKRAAGLNWSHSAELGGDPDPPGEVGEMAEGGDVGDVKQRPELLDFVGDWPYEDCMEQRQARRREEQWDREEEVGRAGRIKAKSGPDVTEFQKLLDLIQTSDDLTQRVPPLARSLSSSSGDRLEREGETRGGAQGSQGDAIYENSEHNMNRSDGVRSELPDCVLDWKADLSLIVSEPSEATLVELGGGEVGSVVNSSRQEIDLNPEVCKDIVSGSESTDPSACLSYDNADLLKASEIVAANVCQDGVVTSDIGVEVGAGTTTEKVTHRTDSVGSLGENSGEAFGSPMGEVGQSPASEGSIEAKGSTFSGGSQERKKGRRSGKLCKLALTFTQNCPSPAPQPPTDPSPNTNAPGQTSSHGSTPSAIVFAASPDCNTGLDSKGSHEPCPDPIPDPQTMVQPHSDPHSLGEDDGCASQTDPQDFAFLWRIDQHPRPDDTTAVGAGVPPRDITVLTGDPFRFVPSVCSAVSAATAVHPLGHCEVPYRMGHEKGTQVEEMEVGVARSRLENLRILSRHFKLVSFDILEDLYDKCHQDLEWTTNLLLDSGERFFRDDDGEGQGYVWGEDEQNLATLCDSLERDLHIGLPSSADEEGDPGDRPASGAPVGGADPHEVASAEGGGALLRIVNEFGEKSHSNTETSGARSKDISASRTKNELSGSRGGLWSQDTTTNGDQVGRRSKQNTTPQPLLALLSKGEETGGGWDAVGQEVTSKPISEGPKLNSSDEETSFENLGAKYGGEELSDMDEMTRLLLVELEESDKREEEQRVDERNSRKLQEENRSRHMNIRSLELTLPTELAMQLTELFGPVGIDAGACSRDDFSVHMDLNLAKMLHEKWKDTIQKSQRQEALSYHLFQESSSHWGESQPAKPGTRPADFLIGADGYASLSSQSEAQADFPIMDHWNAPRTQVSLRDIMSEEHARQQKMEKTRHSRADLDLRDGATLLKEKQLYGLFPGIDRHFLHDIFRDHNYCLKETEQFIRSLLDEGPVKTVVAPEFPRTEPYRAPSKEREKRPKLQDPGPSQFQDTEDPEYEDFRAEASLQKRRQMDNFAKAAEAFKQGKKEVASHYAQQGHLHGQKMKEANRRAAVQIFEQVNSSLLPRNILDLHGLHVDEALQQLGQVLLDKTTEYQQGLCQPQLSVITGRGNHSQGGVARIRPAVIDYLTNKHYRFSEPKTGLVLVSLN
ncbi:NEDD4-binding protein 2 [Gadus macrocephalus]|uniref:NEDD4-binding protein 2 n=1 Tax=Gadus macrocephalus TaxID=80720 RepID=UPI0028CB48EA|nr:NEDD4-binding protein 2 [Gadus macrocephalus]